MNDSIIGWKLTDEVGCTRNHTQWAVGVEHSASGDCEDLCSDGWIHFYTDPLVGLFRTRLFHGRSDGADYISIQTMTLNPPEGWIEVSRRAMMHYLAHCPDYRRASHENVDVFYFVEDKRRFAWWGSDGKCRMSPECLKP